MSKGSLASRFRLEGKTAVIVGGGSGIGHGAARVMSDLGATVICADVDEAKAAAAAKGIQAAGGQAEALRLDITDSGSVQAGLESVAKRHKGFQVLVSTPAVNVRKRLLGYTDAEADKVIDLNLKGTFRVVRAAAKMMNEGTQGEGVGSIIVCSSIRSLVVEPGQGVYASTKAALVQLARGFACELAPRVRVNAVAPGVVDTPLTVPIKSNPGWYQAYAERNALKRWGTEDELGSAIAFLASDAASYITGSVLFVDGGWTAIDGRYEPPL